MKAVIALQKKLLNECSKVSNILLHAHLIASKLELHDFKKWCSLEINGYHSLQDSEVPNYRWIRGTLHLKDPLTGDISALPSPIEFSHKVIRDSVIKLEEYNFDESGGVNLFLSPEIEDYFKKNVENYSKCIAYLRVSKGDYINTLYNIRVKILEFTEELEENGVLGEEWEFTDQEKEMIHNFNYTIHNVESMSNHNIDSKIYNGKG